LRFADSLPLIMSQSASKAIFLSYASQDAEAARRLCEALRANGVEVWFDEAELRGGEIWDSKIKDQIRECALFMPVVSAQTQSRLEGYFRREWRFGAQRTHDMAASVPFLVPVVIDDTSERGAAVPEEFFRAHWIRLSRALPTPEFIAQVERLLGAVPLSASPAAPIQALRPKARAPWWPWAALAVVAAGAAAFVLATNRPGPPVVPLAANEKSIAVLPFENLSDDKSNGYFADGVHEDILTDLANLGGLKVISRTSVVQYRDTKKSLPQIGQELGVAFVLEGSVRRAGNQVRVTGQLINARTDEHVWAQTYDQAFELKDIFAVQSALAGEIATALKAAISPKEKALLETRPTTNLAAYDFYLRGRDQFRVADNTQDSLAKTEPLFEKAVELDPEFALGWLGLAFVHFRAYATVDSSAARLAQIKTCIDTAVRLAPEEPAVILGLGRYYVVINDLGQARACYERVAQAFPNNSDAVIALSLLDRREGRWAEALAGLRKAVILDPRSRSTRESLVQILFAVRRYDEMEQQIKIEMELGGPENLVDRQKTAFLSYSARGSTDAMDALVASVSPAARRTEPNAVIVCAQWAFTRGDAAAVIQLWEEAGPHWRFSPVMGRLDLISVAASFLKLGQPERARPLLERNRDLLMAQLATQPENVYKWTDLALSYAMLGNQAAAREILTKVRAQMEKSNWNGSDLIQIYAWMGEKELALAKLAEVIRLPTTPDFEREYSLRHAIIYWPLQGDPRFEALLSDPRNNVPLF